jgi:hypothetical protein
MGLFEQFPYTNLHELNLDWCLKVAESAQEHLVGYDEDMAAIAQAKLDAEAAAANAYASEVAAAASAADTTQAEEAEAWAKGTKNGVAVGNTAPQYHNNSKYWSDQSASSASAAAASAADTTQAQQAEAWAKGTKNGVPVASDEPQYEDNSKYWAQQATNIVAASMQFSLGSACAFNLTDSLVVKAARTVTKINGSTDSLNIPGLVVFSAPYPQLPAGQELQTDERYVRESDFFVFALYSSDNSAPPTLFIPYYYANTAVMVDDNKAYELRFFRAFDLSTGTWAIDDVAYSSVIGFATNGSFSGDEMTAQNGSSIGDVYN